MSISIEFQANYGFSCRRPSVKYFCDISYDPFLYMQDNKKKYGWVVSLYEYGSTIATLWDETKSKSRFLERNYNILLILVLFLSSEFIGDNPQYLARPNLLDFLSDDGGETYNLCHFWSNFEVGSPQSLVHCRLPQDITLYSNE